MEAGTKEEKHDFFTLDRAFIMSLFHAFSTTVPEGLRLNLARTEVDALQFVMVLRPRLTSFLHRQPFSLRHPAVSMAARQYFSELRACTEEDGQLRDDNTPRHASFSLGVSEGTGAVTGRRGSRNLSVQFLRTAKPVTLEQLNRNRWDLVGACHDVVLRNTPPRRFVVSAVARNSIVNDIICRYWERMTVSPSEMNSVLGRSRGLTSLQDTAECNPSVFATRMTAQQYVYLHLRIAGVLLPPAALEEDLLDSIIFDLRTDATLLENLTGLSFGKTLHMGGHKHGETGAMGSGTSQSSGRQGLGALTADDITQVAESAASKLSTIMGCVAKSFADLPDIGFGQFWESMLELSDNWTSSAHPMEHAIFLMELYCEVFAHEWDDKETALLKTLRATVPESPTFGRDDLISLLDFNNMDLGMVPELPHLTWPFNDDFMMDFSCKSSVTTLTRLSQWPGSICSNQSDVSAVLPSKSPSDGEQHGSEASGSRTSSGRRRRRRKSQKHRDSKDGVLDPDRRRGPYDDDEEEYTSDESCEEDEESEEGEEGRRKKKRRRHKRRPGADGEEEEEEEDEEGRRRRRKRRPGADDEEEEEEAGSQEGRRRRHKRRPGADGEEEEEEEAGSQEGKRRRHKRRPGAYGEEEEEEEAGSQEGKRHRHKRRPGADDEEEETGKGSGGRRRRRSDSSSGRRRRQSGSSGGHRRPGFQDAGGEGDGSVWRIHDSSDDSTDSFNRQRTPSSKFDKTSRRRHDGADEGDADHGHDKKKRHSGSMSGKRKHRRRLDDEEDSLSSDASLVYSIPDSQLSPSALARRQRERDERSRRRREKEEASRKKGGRVVFTEEEMAEKRKRVLESLRVKGVTIAPDLLTDDDIISLSEDFISADLLQRLMAGAKSADEDLKESDFLHILLGDRETGPTGVNAAAKESVLAALRDQRRRRPPETAYARRRREQLEELERQRLEAELAAQREKRREERRRRRQQGGILSPTQPDLTSPDMRFELPPTLPLQPPFDGAGKQPPGRKSLKLPKLPDSESESDSVSRLWFPTMPPQTQQPRRSTTLPSRPQLIDLDNTPMYSTRRFFTDTAPGTTGVHEHSEEQLELFYQKIRTDQPLKGRSRLAPPTSIKGGTYHQLPFVRLRDWKGQRREEQSDGVLSPHPPVVYRCAPVKLFSLTTKTSLCEALKENLQRYIDDKAYLDAIYESYLK